LNKRLAHQNKVGNTVGVALVMCLPVANAKLILNG
jgi:hypothetical protein